MKTVVSCMKDEGLFVTEWVAWHLMCGFDQVMVFTNDCTDGTDDILDVLARRYPVIRVDNPMYDGMGPQVSAMTKAFTMEEFTRSDWVLHCDADEFLRVTCGDHSVEALIDAAGPADCIALLWRYYGDSGLDHWPGGSVLQQLRHCERRPRPHAAMHKALFRPASFGGAIDHMPKSPKRPDVVLRSAGGVEMPNTALFHPQTARHRDAPPEALNWDNAYLAHYAVRCRDLFLLKNVRGDGMARDTDRNHLNSQFWRRSNRNDVIDRALRPQFRPLRQRLAQMRQDPDLVALEQAAWDNFTIRRDTYLTPDNIAAWTVSEDPS